MQKVLTIMGLFLQKRWVWLCVLFLLTGLVSAQDATLHVDASQSLGKISPLFFGANFGQGVVPLDLLPQAKELGIRYMRVGGNISDNSPLSKSNLDLYAYQAREMGAELGITVRLLDGTPEDAAELVRYANIEKGYNIRYWSIGNEPAYFTSVHRAEKYTAEDLARNWRAIAEAMLAVDPNILLVGPDLSQYVVLNVDDDSIEYLEGNGRGSSVLDREGQDWMQTFLRANGDLIDVVSIHRYPYPNAGGRSNASATIEGLHANSREWDTIIPNLRKIIMMTTGRDIPIAVTELNSNSNPTNGGEAGPDTFYNAIWLADVMGRLIQQQVDILAYWTLRSTGDGFGLFGQTGVRPTYYVYALYSQFGTELVAATTDDPDVSIVAALRDDGALTLMVVNMAADEQTRTLALTGFASTATAEIYRLDSEHNATLTGETAIADGVELTLPGQSVTLYIVPPGNP